MKTEMHTPSMKSRDKGARKVAVFYDCACSCGWKVENVTAAAARASHMAHLQSLLGPDAQAERLDRP